MHLLDTWKCYNEKINISGNPDPICDLKALVPMMLLDILSAESESMQLDSFTSLWKLTLSL